MDNVGTIELVDGLHSFLWMRANDGEVSGFVENKQTRKMIKGSYGWYRTNDPIKAAKVAESNLVNSMY